MHGLKRTLVIAALSCGLQFAASAAQACMVNSNGISNYELVEGAHAIVVATAVSEVENDRGVNFDVAQVIKGRSPKRITNVFAVFGDTKPSDPANIASSHPDSNCTRQVFAPGGRYVLFLGKNGLGELGVLTEPWARVAEDYAGEDSLWVQVIQTYLSVQARHRGMAGLRAMEDLRAKLLAGPETPISTALADDIASHLEIASPYKPTPYLMSAYRKAAALDPTSGKSRRLLDHLTTGGHRAARPIFEELLRQPSLDGERLGYVIAFFAKNGPYRRAYRVIEERAPAVLAKADKEEASALIGPIHNFQLGQGPVERWRTDPYVRARWPKMATALRAQIDEIMQNGYFEEAVAEYQQRTALKGGAAVP